MVRGTARTILKVELILPQMIHVWDHFDYTNDVDWWKAQGYPLLKVRDVSVRVLLWYMNN